MPLRQEWEHRRVERCQASQQGGAVALVEIPGRGRRAKLDVEVGPVQSLDDRNVGGGLGGHGWEQLLAPAQMDPCNLVDEVSITARQVQVGPADLAVEVLQKVARVLGVDV